MSALCGKQSVHDPIPILLVVMLLRYLLSRYNFLFLLEIPFDIAPMPLVSQIKPSFMLSSLDSDLLSQELHCAALPVPQHKHFSEPGSSEPSESSPMGRSVAQFILSSETRTSKLPQFLT